MEKTLTISIAAYNVEDYIKHTLDSLIDERIIDDLEILVIDDGGTDKTLEIAKEYANRYPQSIYPIHTGNGGYGSTINKGIELATGKYFKQLDGDDWFETDNLITLIKVMKSFSVDCIVTDYIRYYERSGEFSYKKFFPNMEDGEYKLEEVMLDQRLLMYVSTFQTSLLKDLPNKLTEHCFYTDSEYAAFPIPYINTIYILHKAIYVYRIGAEGQSMNVNGIIKHYREHETVFWNLLDVYNTIPNEKRVSRLMFQNMLEVRLKDQYQYLCFLPIRKSARNEIIEFTRNIQERCPELLSTATQNSRFVKALSTHPFLALPICRRRVKQKWKKAGRLN